MKTFFTPHFQRSYKKLPEETKKAFRKQLSYLLENIRHPSLHTKKYDEAQNIWQARVTRDYRLYFQIENDTYILHDITAHKK